MQRERGGLFMELRCRWVSEVEDKKRGCKFPGLRNEKHGGQKLNWLKGWRKLLGLGKRCTKLGRRGGEGGGVL